LARSVVDTIRRESKTTATHMAVVTRPVSRYNATSVFRTRSTPVYIRFLPAAAATSNQSLGLSLQYANPLWARWTYARLSNHSVMLSNRVMVTRWPPYLLAWPCNRSSDAPALCDAGEQTIQLMTVFKVETLGRHVVWLDANRPRGHLPSTLYRALAQVPRSYGACLVVASNGAQICAQHLSYFDMRVGTPIVLGGAYLAMNTSLVEIDSQVGVMNMYHLGATAATPQKVFRIGGAVVALVTIFFCFGIWGVGRDVIDFPKFIRARRRNRPWPMEQRGMMASAALMVCAVLCILFAALGIQAEAIAAAPMLGPDVWIITCALVAYVSIQLVLHVLLVVVFDVHGHATGEWYETHTVSFETAWARHLLHMTLAISAANLALMPLIAHQGLLAGSDFVLMALIVPQSLLIMLHAYYATGALVLASILDEARARFKVFVGGQLVLLAALFVTNILFMSGPVLSEMSTFVSQRVNFVSGMGLELLSLIMGLVLLLRGYKVHLDTEERRARQSSSSS
jgi:hypothetical protein